MFREYLFIVAVVSVAWLTAGGIAVRSVSRIWLRHWAERRLRGSDAALTYLERPQRLLAAASASVAMMLVLAGALTGARFGALALVWHLGLLAAVIIVVGQMVPRAIARRWPSALVPVLLPALRIAEVMAVPVLAVGRIVLRRLELPPSAGSGETEADAIQDLLREGELEGVGEHDEIAIISGVVEFAEKRVQDVMTPRADIFALEQTTDGHWLAARIAQSGYSRVPIFVGSVDRIVGMVHVFDVLKVRGETVPPLRPVTYAAPPTAANDLLFRMLRQRQHMAIVRDDAGTTLGLVTLEDLLEELVGDIRDEHDEPAPAHATAGAAAGARVRPHAADRQTGSR